MPFTPSHSEEHLPPPSYRGCWHGVSRGFLTESVMIETRRKSLTSGIALLHSRYIAGSGFRPLSKIPHCCPPLESGPCLSPSVADHPKRPAKHHWLGKPLPYQLPNTTQAHQTARLAFISIWPELFGRFPRVTHPFATLFQLPFEDHALVFPLLG